MAQRHGDEDIRATRAMRTRSVILLRHWTLVPRLPGTSGVHPAEPREYNIVFSCRGPRRLLAFGGRGKVRAAVRITGGTPTSV
jgi:hypothetical protein